MLEHLINAKGGLYNRITRTILLKPYNLKGVHQFLEYRGIYLSHKQVLDLYMVFGGIPHYLKQITKGKSAAQIINRVCFQKEGLLYGEFDRIFYSLFNHAEAHRSIIRAISKQRYGISRKHLIRETGISSGGTLHKRLEELEAAGFIQSYVPYDRKKKDHCYRIIDEYIHFYLQWIEPLKEKGIEGGKSFWQTKVKTPKALSWAGYSFENICLKHVDQIREALDLESINCDIGSWRYVPKKGSKEPGAQIDLLFDRDDGVITLCEIKYSANLFLIEKSYAKQLANKIEVFDKHVPTNKQIFIAMITTMGIKHTLWSEELVQNQVILQDLFRF